jgi:hypothetical protein
VVDRGAQWLSGLQGPDGSLGASPGLPAVGWATPYAVLVWNAVGGYAECGEKACGWLLDRRGQTLPRDPSIRLAVEHDTSLVGWPWVEGTHSWLEPTAMAILGLSLEGLHGHPRVLEGVRLIVDRALPHGGWNYGNKSVFRTELRPQPGPTGLALLALATRGDDLRPPVVDPALGYLKKTLPEVDSPCSLGWGVLGMRAWDAAPAGSGDWLRRSFERHSGRPDTACGLGLLLLAAVEQGPGLLGARAGAAVSSEANRGSMETDLSGGIGR